MTQYNDCPGRARPAAHETSPASVHACMRVWAAARRPGEIHVHAGRSDRSTTMHCMCMPARAGTHRLRRCMGRANKLNACICMIETGQTHASSNQTGDYWRGRMQARANEAAGSRARPLSSHAARAAAAAPSRNDAKRPGEVACARSLASARRALPCSLSHMYVARSTGLPGPVLILTTGRPARQRARARDSPPPITPYAPRTAAFVAALPASARACWVCKQSRQSALC